MLAQQRFSVFLFGPNCIVQPRPSLDMSQNQPPYMFLTQGTLWTGKTLYDPRYYANVTNI